MTAPNPTPPNDPATPPNQPPNQPPTPTQPPAPNPANPTDPGPINPGGPDDSAAKLVAMQAQLANTAKDRDNFKKILDAIQQAVNPDAKKMDPEKLAESLQQRDQELAENRRELAVLRVAGGEIGNQLLDSRSFMKAIASLDPTSDEFVAKVKEFVDKRKPQTGEDNPQTPGKAPANGKSGGADLTGGRPAGQKQITRAQLKTMTPAQIVKAQDDGLLADILGGGA